ncbi:MAG: hypothetical protein ABFR62_11535, partial [Bacteroidota bacterium]
FPKVSKARFRKTFGNKKSSNAPAFEGIGFESTPLSGSPSESEVIRASRKKYKVQTDEMKFSEHCVSA